MDKQFAARFLDSGQGQQTRFGYDFVKGAILIIQSESPGFNHARIEYVINHEHQVL